MQVFLNGFISGLSIALLALAFQMVYLPTKVFFIGIAGVYMVAPFIYSAILKTGVSWPLAVVGSLVLVILLSLLFEKANHAPLARKGASDAAHLIASLGGYILIVQVVILVWGNSTKVIRAGVDLTFKYDGIVLTGSQLLSAGSACVLLVSFFALLHYSDFGLRIRALADNPIQFSLYGNNTEAYRLVVFGLAGFFTAAASLLTAYDIGYTPNGGLSAVLLAVVAVIIGGRSSFAGPVIGGLFLGIIRTQVVWQFSARWQEAFTFAVLAIFLLLRPQGLIAQKNRVEETV